MTDELTPQNRKILCTRIETETGFPADALIKCFPNASADDLIAIKDMMLEDQRNEAIRQGFYTPRANSDGLMPAEADVRTPRESFVEMMSDIGF